MGMQYDTKLCSFVQGNCKGFVKASSRARNDRKSTQKRVCGRMGPKRLFYRGPTTHPILYEVRQGGQFKPQGSQPGPWGL